MFNLGDDYTIRARVLPAAIVILPLLVAGAGWFGSHGAITPMLWASAAGVALVALLGEMTRDLGKDKEMSLRTQWGGFPTTRWLRHSDATIAGPRKAQLHECLHHLYPNLPIPTRGEEMASPENAEDAYSALIVRLREDTRDRGRFPLVFTENVSYGFRRNLWAMKPVGMVLAIASVAWSLYTLARQPETGNTSIASAALALGVFMLAVWAMRITPKWVARASDAYAERLFAAAETLARDRPTGSKLIVPC